MRSQEATRGMPYSRPSTPRSRLICSALTTLVSAPVRLPARRALTQLNSVWSTTPNERAVAAMLWPPSTRRTASCLNSCVYRALGVVFVITALLAWSESLSKGYVFWGQGHKLPVAENLLNREFNPPAPDSVWASDITYVATDEGWLYLAVIIDLFSRQVVGWSMKPHIKRDLVIDALHMAWFRRQPAAGLIFHSDRGSQYCSAHFRRALTDYRMRSSMSGKGNCWDNAPTESLWGSLKVGRLHGRRFDTRRDAMDEIVDWLGFYNHRRIHSSLGYVSPMQFERAWLAAQQRQAA